jgi:hypothetical protein
MRRGFKYSLKMSDQRQQFEGEERMNEESCEHLKFVMPPVKCAACHWKALAGELLKQLLEANRFTYPGVNFGFPDHKAIDAAIAKAREAGL